MLSISTLLSKINAEENREKQIEMIKEYSNNHLVFFNILKEFYSPEATIKLPELTGLKFNELPGNEGQLYRMARMLPYFRFPYTLSESRLNRTYATFMETICKEDAEMFLYHARNGKLPFRRIDTKLIAETFGWDLTAYEESSNNVPVTSNSAPNVDTITIDKTEKKTRVKKSKVNS